jgi:hypothetical protein
MSGIVVVTVEVGIVAEIAVDLERRKIGKSPLVKVLLLERSVGRFSHHPREAVRQPKWPIADLVVRALGKQKELSCHIKPEGWAEELGSARKVPKRRMTAAEDLSLLNWLRPAAKTIAVMAVVVVKRAAEFEVVAYFGWQVVREAIQKQTTTKLRPATIALDSLLYMFDYY